MGNSENDREEFNRFVRKLIGHRDFVIYYDQGKSLLRELKELGKVMSPGTRVKAWHLEPLVGRCSTILDIMNRDPRHEVRRAVPRYVRAIAERSHTPQERLKMLDDMICVAEEILTPLAVPRSTPPTAST